MERRGGEWDQEMTAGRIQARIWSGCCCLRHSAPLQSTFIMATYNCVEGMPANQRGLNLTWISLHVYNHPATRCCVHEFLLKKEMVSKDSLCRRYITTMYSMYIYTVCQKHGGSVLLSCIYCRGFIQDEIQKPAVFQLFTFSKISERVQIIRVFENTLSPQRVNRIYTEIYTHLWRSSLQL